MPLLQSWKFVMTHDKLWTLARMRLSRLRAKLYLALGMPWEATALLDYDRIPIRLSVSSAMEYHTRLHSCKKEPETIAWIEQVMRPGEAFYDVGANVGAYTLVAAQFWGINIPIVAIEPCPANYCRLVRNLALNNCADRVITLPIALSEAAGILPFHFQNLTAGGSLHSLGEAVNYRGDYYTPAATIPMLTYDLDTLVEQFHLPPPMHLKLDVDGTEMAVLRGARKTLHSVKTVLVEVDSHRADCAAIQALLEENGLCVIGRYPYRYRAKFPEFSGISNVIFKRVKPSTLEMNLLEMNRRILDGHWQ